MTTASEVHTVYYLVQWYSKQVSGDFGHNETCLHSSYVYRFIQYAKDVKNMIKNMTLIFFGGQKNVQKNVPGNLICTQNSWMTRSLTPSYILSIYEFQSGQK